MVRVIGPHDPNVPGKFDLSAQYLCWTRDLHPTVLGPVPLYPTAGVKGATSVENAWQGAKVYFEHAGPDGPYLEYLPWAHRIWESKRSCRPAVGKDRFPAYVWWNGERLDYASARKRVYASLYARAAVKTEAFARLLRLYRLYGNITLLDEDGYDHRALGMTFRDVAECLGRRMGHAFVLAVLLERQGDKDAGTLQSGTTSSVT